jgi:hypothetical protein
VFVLENYFTSKWFAAVRETFSNAYPDKEVLNKTIQILATKFQDTGTVCDREHVRSRRVLEGETLRGVKETLKTTILSCCAMSLKLTNTTAVRGAFYMEHSV